MTFKLCNNGKSVVGTNLKGETISYSIEAEEYKQWLADGGTPEPEFTEAELLAQAKEAKVKQLEQAFDTASKLPVTVGTKSYNGGKESAQAIRDYIQIVSESGGSEYHIWDTTNVISIYTLAEATAIKLAIASVVANAEFNLRTKKNLVDSATTIQEVEVIIW